MNVTVLMFPICQIVKTVRLSMFSVLGHLFSKLKTLADPDIRHGGAKFLRFRLKPFCHKKFDFFPNKFHKKSSRKFLYDFLHNYFFAEGESKIYSNTRWGTIVPYIRLWFEGRVYDIKTVKYATKAMQWTRISMSFIALSYFGRSEGFLVTLWVAGYFTTD